MALRRRGELVEETGLTRHTLIVRLRPPPDGELAVRGPIMAKAVGRPRFSYYPVPKAPQAAAQPPFMQMMLAQVVHSPPSKVRTCL